MSKPTTRRARGRPPTHGARLLARVLRRNELDGRSVVARALAELGDALATDRGGWSNVTAGERILIERVAAETVFLRMIESWAFRQPELVVNNGDGPRLLAPLSKGYTSHLGALTRALAALGIRPDKIDRLPDLGQYLAERNTSGHSAAPASTAAPADATPTPTPTDAASAPVHGQGGVQGGPP